MYAQDWITRQVTALTKSNADIFGLNDINIFENPKEKQQLAKWIQVIGPSDKSELPAPLPFHFEAPLVSFVMSTANMRSFITRA